MKKTGALFIICLLIVALSKQVFAQQTNEYYLGVFSNTTGTIKFTMGVYPSSINQSKKNDGTLYSVMSVALVNNEKAEPIEWNDFKIYILLKDGTLVYNFLTTATTGEYACKYQVAPGTTHMQYYCYDKIFSATDIEKVWLHFGDSQFQPLFLYKDEIPAEKKAPATTPSKKSGKL
ncbi:hypothetical protein [Cytophaga aurantiaca]|uniref:hypothetical protein n=1 Tax=Cytophaga aurantiaca TaxID=29530 RepID=UPI000376DA89|nr:hypothetical protein [Cytophaga aurantiaca]